MDKTSKSSFLDDDHEITRSNLWAARALLGILLLVASINIIQKATAGPVAPAGLAGYAFGSFFVSILIYWGLLRVLATNPEP